MTKERAIELLKNFNLYDEPNCMGYWDCDECVEALYMGIEAIKEQPKRGKWILGKREWEDNYTFTCSQCWHRIVTPKTQKIPYCWFCGARMECDER